MQIPGIGPGRVDKILAYRQSKGGFKKVEELRAVGGIGDATLVKLKPWVEVDPATGDDESSDEPQRLSRKPTEPQPLSRKPTAEVAKPSTSKPLPSSPIDLNRATAEELQQLRGIGPTLAQRIVEQRERKPFTHVEDLRRVSGIGAKKFQEIKPFVIVSN